MKSHGWFLCFVLFLEIVVLYAHVLNYDSVTVCNGILKEIQCPNNENIHVLQGFFGKWRNHDCHGESIDPDNLPTCREDRSKITGLVKDLCQGKNTCTLEADKSIYGEPCPDNKAYLYVTFFCLRNGQKLIHQRTMNNEEVVTVQSHGYIIREEKSHLEEHRQKQEEQEARRNELLNLGNPDELNPNPRPIDKHKQSRTGENKVKLGHADQTKEIKGSTVKEINTKNTPIDFVELRDEKSKKAEELHTDNHPLMFTNTEDALKLENSLKFEKIKEENAETRRVKEKPQTSDTVAQVNSMESLLKNTSVNQNVEPIENKSTGKLLNLLELTQNYLPTNASVNDNIIESIANSTKLDIENVSFSKSNAAKDVNSEIAAPIEKKENLTLEKHINDTELGTKKSMTSPKEASTLVSDESQNNETLIITEKDNHFSDTTKSLQNFKMEPEHENKQLMKEQENQNDEEIITKSKLPTRESIQGVDLSSDIHSTVICNGESKLIACLPEEGIRIYDAFYGKRSGEDCHGKIPYKDESPTCSALDAKENVEKSCNNKQTCLLFSDDNIFGKSLCPHVNKYLYVTYTCAVVPQEQPSPLPVLASKVEVNRKPQNKTEQHATQQAVEEEFAVSKSIITRENKTIKLCNGEKKVLTCDKEQGLKINKAFYGKKIGTDCRGELSYRDDIPECNNPRALDSIKFLCENQKKCEVLCESPLFGDDVCPGVNKYLEVDFGC